MAAGSAGLDGNALDGRAGSLLPLQLPLLPEPIGGPVAAQTGLGWRRKIVD